MKAVLDSLEGLADAVRSEYDFRDGKYYLKLEGAPVGFAKQADLESANTKLAEFRDNNRALNTQKTELETKLKSYEGVDPAKYAEFETKIKELEKKGVTAAGDVADIVKNAVAAAVKPLEEREAQRAASEKAAIERADRESLRSALTAAGVAVGVAESAMTDYVNRGMGVFKVIEGEIAARKGDAPIFSKQKPAEVLTVAQWATELQEEAPHLFKPSRGGGAGGNGGNGNGGGPKKTISADPLEFGKNIEGIAKGEVIVQI